jgi:sortase A
VLVLAAMGVVLCGQGLWIPAKALLAQQLLERAFARSILTGEPVKPWPWADTGPVARIEAPRLGRAAVVLRGDSGQALAFGPGHVGGTVEPGRRGVAVYAAHRDTHFAFLGELRRGDVVEVVRRDGQRLRFRVTGARVARWDASGIPVRASGRRLALATCWPLDSTRRGPLRYIVEAELAP